MNYVTITQLLEVGEGTVLAVHTHVLACDQKPGQGAKTAVEFWYRRTKPQYSWFNDKCNQELMASIHEVLCCNQLENLIAHSYQSKGASSPVHEFRRSEELRMLFTFKKYGYRQHIVIPDQSMQCQPLTPRASFISDHGKRVLPYLGVATYGSGYRSYRVLPDALHAFVDHFEVTSNKGIIKVLSMLDPKHKQSPDIISYFKSDDQGHQMEEGLAQVPLDCLKQRGSKPARGQRYGRTLRKNKRGLLRDVSSLGQSNNILKVFEKYKRSEQRCEEELKSVIGDIDSVVIDEFFDFGSTQPSMLPAEEDHPVINEGCEDHPVNSNDLDSGTETAELIINSSDDQVEKGVSHKKKRLHSPTDVQRSPLLHTCADNQSVFETMFDSEELLRDECTTDMISCIDKDHASKESDPFEITDDDIDMALFDIKTPEVLCQQDSSSQCDSQSQTHSPIAKSKSLPTPTNFFVNEHSETGMGKSKSDSVLHSPFLVRDYLDDVTNTVHQPLANFDALVRGEPSVGGGVGSGSGEDLIDLTGEHDDIVFSSQSSQNDATKSKKKVPLNLEQILKGAKNVKDLSQKQVGQWIRFRKPIILDIFKRKVFSQRHEDYLSYPKKRAALVYQVDLRMFRKNQVELINDCLLKIFCSKHGRYFSYVMSVLHPECLIRMIADVHGVDFNQAELMMFNYKSDSIDLTDSFESD